MDARSHYFFDLDNTLAYKGGVIPVALVQLLGDRQKRMKSVVVVSGATKVKIDSQLNGLKPDAILAESGNEVYLGENFSYARPLGECFEIWDHLYTLMLHFQGGHAQMRRCQLSFSPVGHDAPQNIKNDFDPTGDVRRKALELYPFHSHDFTVSIGGTTCFDYTNINGTKGKNITGFLKYMGWDAKQCVYFGDSLQEGGNDHSVVGVIDTVPVTSPDDTLAKL
jgi:hydroxymethylpyrimidine pyrophosphatase-like HAD family hydrolase